MATVADASLRKANTTHYDRLISAPLLSWKDKIGEALRYRRAYGNYIRVLSAVFSNRFPVEASLRDARKVQVSNETEALVYSFASFRPETGRAYVERIIAFEGGQLEFVYRTSKGSYHLKLKGFATNGDPRIFLRDEYHQLPVEDASVVDVGASIGDSAIYFACKGAAKVLAFEPLPITFTIAKENLEANHMGQVVTLIRKAVARTTGQIMLDPEAPAQLGASHLEREDGVETQLTTLDEIVQDYGLRDPILKIDVEGDEYGIISTCSDETLRLFSHILVEYHFGHKAISDTLKTAGFEVSTTSPRLLRLHSNGPLRMYIGYIYARRMT